MKPLPWYYACNAILYPVYIILYPNKSLKKAASSIQACPLLCRPRSCPLLSGTANRRADKWHAWNSGDIQHAHT